MRILAFNCGSSSIKCAVVDTDTGARPFDLHVERIGQAGIDPRTAVTGVIAQLRNRWSELGELDAVVHRVVHGGELFTVPTLIDDHVLLQLGAQDRVAPLHNPSALHAIQLAMELFAKVPHIAIFDTAFHRTLPAHAREYALPGDVRARFGIRRFGFHGISHADVARRAAAHLGKDPRDLRLISCHLGSGASLTAIEHGLSVETSMGMTPLEGLVMGTRAGDVDAGVILALARKLPIDTLDELLNKRSGLVGLTGTDDLRDIERRAGDGDEHCRLALELYVHRIRKYLGAYTCVMGGVDAIIFTGGVGEHSSLVRERCLRDLAFLGATLDVERNHLQRVDARAPTLDIATVDSRVRLLVVKADEERAMADAAAALLAAQYKPAAKPRIPIAVSARHAHLSQSTIDRLFGVGYRLRPRNALSQTGQFSAEETVRLIGPRGSLEHVRLMGPPRASDQVEIARSDEVALGIDAPLRLSGELAATAAVTIEGPAGRVALPAGVIRARRHIHVGTDEALRLGLADSDVVSVRIDSAGRDLTFDDVSVRVAPEFHLELHLDTDEGNAADVRSGDAAELVAIHR